MTYAEKLNLFLLVFNGNFAICLTFVLIAALSYIVWQFREKKMTRRDWHLYVPLGITVAASMAVRDFGELIVRVTVWEWRSAGAEQALSMDHLLRIGIGSAVGLLGILLVIRMISRPRYGEKMWMAALIFAALNTVTTIWLFLE